jgi:hypothetical protein
MVRAASPGKARGAAAATGKALVHRVKQRCFRRPRRHVACNLLEMSIKIESNRYRELDSTKFF